MLKGSPVKSRLKTMKSTMDGIVNKLQDGELGRTMTKSRADWSKEDMENYARELRQEAKFKELEKLCEQFLSMTKK